MLNLFKKNNVKLVKSGKKYKFTIKLNDKDIAKFIHLVTEDYRNVTIRGSTMTFIVDDETKSSTLLEFFKAAKIIK